MHSDGLTVQPEVDEVSLAASWCGTEADGRCTGGGKIEWRKLARKGGAKDWMESLDKKTDNHHLWFFNGDMPTWVTIFVPPWVTGVGTWLISRWFEEGRWPEKSAVGAIKCPRNVITQEGDRRGKNEYFLLIQCISTSENIKTLLSRPFKFAH